MKLMTMVTTMATVLWAAAGIAGAQGAPAAGPAAKPAEPAPAAAEEHKALAPADLKWGDSGPPLPKGAKISVLYGDPSKEGLFIVRAKMPAGYKVPPHWHPTTENVTVLSGSLAIGMGDKIDPKAKGLSAGSFYSMPAKMHHFAVALKASEIEISAMGPFQLNYINPDDDPAKTAAAAPAK